MCAYFAVIFTGFSTHPSRRTSSRAPLHVLQALCRAHAAAENYGGYLRAAGTKTTATSSPSPSEWAELRHFRGVLDEARSVPCIPVAQLEFVRRLRYGLAWLFFSIGMYARFNQIFKFFERTYLDIHVIYLVVR